MNKVKLPLRYDSEGQYVFDADNKMILEIRGWGWIQKLNPDKIGCSQSEFQDKLGGQIVSILNNNLMLNSECVE